MVSELMILIGSGVGLIIGSMILVSKPLSWLPFKVMRVKSSGGKKILMRERKPSGNTYTVANIENSKDAIWNDKKGFFEDDKGRVTFPHEAIHTEWGCKILEFDAEGNLYCPNGKIITGFDPKHMQDLLNREAEKPPENSGMEKLKLFLAVFTFIGLLIIGFLVFKNSQKSDMIIESFNQLQNVMINSTVHTV